MDKFAAFARIAEIEFADIVLSTQDLGHKLRIYVKDKSFIDFFYTTKLKSQRFSIHWERIHVDKTIYRIDNTPDKNWRHVKSFPIHFHHQTYHTVRVPPFTLGKTYKLETILRNFLRFTQQLVIPTKK